MKSPTKPRGIKNNNPLNIRRSKSRWKGLKAIQTDKAFCQFEKEVFGWRAAFYLLCYTYYKVWGCCTIRDIISRWAPNNENDTEAYIKRVCELTKIKPSEKLGHPTETADSWLKLGWAMAIVENGEAAVLAYLHGVDQLEGFKMAMDSCYPEGR